MLRDGHYNPADPIKLIHKKYRFSFSFPKNLIIWKNYQLDLLYFYLPDMDEADARRARRTIKKLENEIVLGSKAEA